MLKLATFFKLIVKIKKKTYILYVFMYLRGKENNISSNTILFKAAHTSYKINIMIEKSGLIDLEFFNTNEWFEPFRICLSRQIVKQLQLFLIFELSYTIYLLTYYLKVIFMDMLFRAYYIFCLQL